MKRKQHQYSLTTVLIWASKIAFGLVFFPSHKPKWASALKKLMRRLTLYLI